MQVLRQGTGFRLKPKSFFLGAFFSVLVIVAVGVFFFQTTYNQRFYNGVFIDGTNVSKLTKAEAISILSTRVEQFPQTVTLTAGETTMATSAAALGIHREYSMVVDEAFTQGRTKDGFGNLKKLIDLSFHPQNFSSTLSFEPEKVQEFVTALAISSHIPDQQPSATLKNGTVSIFPGKVGQSINIEDTVTQLIKLSKQESIALHLPMVSTGTELTQIQTEQAIQRAEKFKGKSIEGKHDVITIAITDTQMIEALAFPEGYNDANMAKILDLFREKIDRPAQDAIFQYDQNSYKVSKFQPDLDGLTIDTADTNEKLIATLKKIEQGDQEKIFTLELKIASKPANITLASLNTLGINQRVGYGESFYEHSIPSRIHNVSRASEIVNYTIVKAGEEFSFNKTLGEVSKETGFQPAYVIKSGQTVLGDGGGVCQVSTTLFRALLDSGLNITKRKPHSYRVSYYELNRDPGFDATVYAGDVDLRFVNDSPAAVLLQFTTYPERKYMNVAIYGTSDGRTTEIVGYKKWDAVKAPPSLYFDDPTSPPGKLVQIDWAVSGIKAQFTHRVKDKDGNLMRENTYYSNYIPWSAKYRRGV